LVCHSFYLHAQQAIFNARLCWVGLLTYSTDANVKEKKNKKRKTSRGKGATKGSNPFDADDVAAEEARAVSHHSPLACMQWFNKLNGIRHGY
jgi:hypothetical protein